MSTQVCHDPLESERYQTLRRYWLHPLDILFWACLMLGGAYMTVSFLMGGVHHAAGHAHVGHAPHLHLPHTGHDLGHAVGHGAHGHAPGHADAAHVGHHGAGHGEAAEAEEAPAFSILSYLNPMFVSCFCFGFGGLGLLLRWGGLLAPQSAVGGAVGGLALYSLAYLLVARVFGASEATSHNKREELVGTRANVMAPIAGAQPGMVSYVVSGARQTLRAISDDLDPIPVGAVVQIRKIEKDTAHVIRLS